MAMDYFFDLMLEDIQKRFKDDYKKYQSLFLLQSSYMKTHWQEINKAFPLYIERYNREVDTEAFLIENIFHKEQKVSKKSEKTLISDLEAQNFLLESVFKLDKKLFI